MPALVQGGPKLPSFQKLKSKKRASPQAAEELENAPKSKKPAPLTKTATPASEGGVEKKEKPRKAQKKNEWNNRMAAERRERLEKKEKGTKTSSESAPAARTKAAPGSNWQQLKSTMTHAKDPKFSRAKKVEKEQQREETSAKAKAEPQNKAQKPAGWNPGSKSEENTEIVAIDCEMVGVGADGSKHSLARVVIVNYYGAVLLDRFVAQMEPVTDFRTKISGVRPSDLKGAPSLRQVQEEIYKILKDKIVVGHQLQSDFKVLMLDHPKLYIRDTARYAPLMKSPGNPHSLKHLAKEILDLQIQADEHDPAEDARIALLVYRHVQRNWEQSVKNSVKNPSSINPITKIVERANRAALAAKPSASKNSKSISSSQTSSNKSSAKKDASNDSEDSWASSDDDSDDDSDDSGSGSESQSQSDSDSE